MKPRSVPSLRERTAEAQRSAIAVWCAHRLLPAPVFEYRFAAPRRWRFDVAWPEHHVAVEVHGGVYRQGHHTRGTGFLDDREKMAHAQLLGWRVFECAPSGKHPQTLYSSAMLTWLRGVL